jgi:protease I
MAKKVLLFLAYQGYQPVEYGDSRHILEKAGIKVLVASTQEGFAQAKPSVNHVATCKDSHCGEVDPAYARYAKAPVDVVLNDVNPNDYDGIFLIGGPGGLEYLDNETVYDLLKTTATSKIPFGAICVSPRILAHAGLLDGKMATGWDGDGKLDEIFEMFKVNRVHAPVVVDGSIITADGPRSAKKFGAAIVELLKP